MALNLAEEDLLLGGSPQGDGSTHLRTLEKLSAISAYLGNVRTSRCASL